MNPDLQHPVAERDLPTAAAAKMRIDLLQALDNRPEHRWLPYAVAATVAALAVGGGLYAARPADHRSAAAPVTQLTPQDPVWQRHAIRACRTRQLTPGQFSPPAAADLRLLNWLTADRRVYVWIAGDRATLHCTLDRKGNALPGAQPFDGWSTSDGTGGIAARTIDVAGTGGNSRLRFVGGQAGAGIVRVVARWSNGMSASADVRNGTFIIRRDHAERLVGRHNSAGEPVYRSFHVIGYDGHGRVAQTVAMPATP